MQLDHQGFVQPSPLVLRLKPLKSATPTTDRDRPGSRRSEPSSRTTLIGEQPNPWGRLQSQDVMSRHRGAKPLRRYGRSGAISLLSRGTFYPMSYDPSTRDRRITRALFRDCSTRRSRSKSGLCSCTRHTVSIRAEPNFALLRYLFGGDRPSQTARHALFFAQIHGNRS